MSKIENYPSNIGSPTKQLSDREIVEAMNAILQNVESKKAMEEEKLYVEQKVDKTMFDLKNLWNEP